MLIIDTYRNMLKDTLCDLERMAREESNARNRAYLEGNITCIKYCIHLLEDCKTDN